MERSDFVSRGYEGYIVSVYVDTPTLLDMIRICRQARSEEIEQYEAVSGSEWDYEYVATMLFAKRGMKFAFCDDNLAFSVAGWEPVIEGVWESWMIGTTEDWKKYWRSITKLSRKTVELMFSDPKTRRLQITALASRTKACEWFLRGLRFEFESTIKNFGVNGEDLSVYVKFRE